MYSNFYELLFKKRMNEIYGYEPKPISVIEKEGKIYIPLDEYVRPILKSEGKGIYFECGLVEIEGKIYRKFIKAKTRERYLRRGYKTIVLDESYIDTDSVKENKWKEKK